jgi:MoxR-like ATPase
MHLLAHNGYKVWSNVSPTTDVIEEEQFKIQVPEVNTDGQHQMFGTLLKVIAARCNALLIGPAGSGKTTAAKNVATTLGLKYYSISVGAQSTKFEFFGYTDANGKFIRTLFREAFEHGGVFLIDEMDAGNPNVIVSINQALANDECAFADKMVKKHPDFVVIASANTWGNGGNREYVGRNQLDAATKDRFIPLMWSYDMVLEAKMCPNKEWLAEVRRVRSIVEKNKMRFIVSPRASEYGARLIAAGLSFNEVREMILIKDMNDSEKAIVLSGR